MVKYTAEDIQKLMTTRPQNIRNLAVIAHVDHGKSTLTDSLLAGAGLIKYEDTGKRVTDNLPDEKAQGITIKSTGVSMLFSLPADVDSSSTSSGTSPEEDYLINLIDSPGHVDFSSEVTAALRLTDGALVVVDCVEGVCVQTETVLRSALAEKIRPVLAVNKLDRAFTELQLTNEEIFTTLQQVIQSTQSVLATYSYGETDAFLELDPVKGNVAFSAGFQGWAFTIPQFAKFYSKKSKLSPKDLAVKLWGDHFFNLDTKKWSTNPKDGVRGFCHFILEPIRKIFNYCLNGDLDKLKGTIQNLSLAITPAELERPGKELLKITMQRWLPAHVALVDMMVSKLPSPLEAQKYRVETLYTGPQDDETATAIRNCDPNGPLVIYIAKMVPTSESGRFYAYGRVFSGTVSNTKVRIIGATYTPENKEDEITGVSVQRVYIMTGKKADSVDAVPCGNVVALSGVDKHIIKSATITSSENSYPIKDMKHSVAPVVRCAVQVKKPADLPKLVEAMKRLCKIDTLVECSTIEETGEHVIAGAGELHLSICIRDLKKLCGENVELKVSDPLISFRETVGAVGEVRMAQSPNKHNKLFVRAEPLGDELTNALDAKKISLFYKDCGTPEAVASRRTLVDNYEWDLSDAKKIWVFNLLTAGPNVVVDQSQGVQYMNELKDSFSTGFVWAARQGALCEEPLRGVRFNILDAKLHADAIHRGPGQIIPSTRKVLQAAQLTASPRLLEPIFHVEVQCPVDCMGAVFSALNRRRGVVFDSQVRAPLMTIKAHVPVLESFGLVEFLRANTSGQAFAQCVFSHWSLLPGSMEDDDSSLFKQTVTAVRTRKGLAAQVPPPE